MADANIGQMSALMPTMISRTVRTKKFDSRFLREIERAAEKVQYLNSNGNKMSFVTQENESLFSVAEGGQILQGAPVEYAQTTMDIRKMWKSASFTGDVERQLDNNIARIEMEKPALRGNFGELNRMAHNRLVQDLVWSTLRLYAHHENYFALQGTDKSTIGVVTALPGTLGTGNVGFSWSSTSQGNRIFAKNQRIEFRDGAGVTQRTTGLAASSGSYFSTVDTKVNKQASVNATNGTVHFDQLPSNLQIGDTAHFQNSYGALPQGFTHYIDDQGSFKGQTRATNPEQFSSVVTRLTGSPNLTPMILTEQGSFLEGKVGYDMPVVAKIVVNKAQKFQYYSQVYAQGNAFTQLRYVETSKDGGRINKYDPSINTSDEALKFGDWEVLSDEHMPPAEVFFVNFASWKKYVRTPVKPYAFDSGSYFINPIDQYGVRLDARMFTIFSEYNWDCIDPTSNSRITGLAFNSAHVAQP